MIYWSKISLPLAIASVCLSLKAETASYTHDISPVIEKNCISCHGPKKQKGGLRLDSYSFVLQGTEDGPIVKLGNAQDSELYRRLTLHPGDDDFMPAGGKPPLKAHEIELIKQWIAASAPEKLAFEFVAVKKSVLVAKQAAPDYRPKIKEASAKAESLGVRLVPRSSIPTDGLVLRTASNPKRCTDAVIEQLSSYSDLIVEAELSRTAVTSKSLAHLSKWKNLQLLDLSYTHVSDDYIDSLAQLKDLQSLNISGTQIGKDGLAKVNKLTSVARVWAFMEAPAGLLKK